MIKFINEIKDEQVGGKARGLKILRDIGLSVPEALVIIHPNAETLNDDVLKNHLESWVKGQRQSVLRQSVKTGTMHPSLVSMILFLIFIILMIFVPGK